MKQSGHLNPREETGTGCPVTSKYGRILPNKHGGVGRQQQQLNYAEQNCVHMLVVTDFGYFFWVLFSNFCLKCLVCCF